MTGVPWLVPSTPAGGFTRETRRALGPLVTLVEDPRVRDVFVLGGGQVYLDTGMGAFRAEGLSVSRAQALEIARDVLTSAGATLVLCEELSGSVVVERRLARGVQLAHATARAGVADSGEK